jgi:hypothetical protein
VTFHVAGLRNQEAPKPEMKFGKPRREGRRARTCTRQRLFGWSERFKKFETFFDGGGTHEKWNKDREMPPPQQKLPSGVSCEGQAKTLADRTLPCVSQVRGQSPPRIDPRHSVAANTHSDNPTGCNQGLLGPSTNQAFPWPRSCRSPAEQHPNQALSMQSLQRSVLPVARALRGIAGNQRTSGE